MPRLTRLIRALVIAAVAVAPLVALLAVPLSALACNAGPGGP